jgi:ribosomal protein L20
LISGNKKTEISYNEMIFGNKKTEITVTMSWYLELRKKEISYNELISGNKKTEITATMYNVLISGNRKQKSQLQWVDIYMINTCVLRYEFGCIMSIHCSVGEKLLFFGTEYHFVRELKFPRGLSTLENLVP